jgi:hypothetical protein
MPRHKLPPRGEAGRLPEWVKKEKNDCLVSVAEDAYRARGLAMDDYRADRYPQCAELLQAGEKSLRALESRRTAVEKRCAEGARAARKFWEAKVCARRLAE